jgi:tRNA (Thr-GGU) A37 N-methylase
MKQRFYMEMKQTGIVECQYNSTRKVTHKYQCEECAIHVYGTFKESGKKRHQLDYAVMILVQDKGGRVGRLYHE